MNLTATVEKRKLAEVANEWVDAVVKLTAGTSAAGELLLLHNLGLLGQRLIYESHALGLNDGLKIRTEAREVIGG